MFFQKIWLCHTQHKGFYYHAQTQKNLMIEIQEKTWTDSRMEGWLGWLVAGRTLFHRALLATTKGPTSLTAVDWHLKVKGIKYSVGLTKNYCIKVSIQKISLIDTLIPKIQQILRSHELNGHARF